jgi:predicted dehydrogenase
MNSPALEADMDRLRIAVVGPGLIGKKHIDLIRSRDDCVVAAIVAPDHEQNHSIVRELDVPLFFSVQAALAEANLDGVIVSSPNPFHAEQATACILAGVPVLIEKPITDSFDSGLELVTLAESSGAKVLVGHHRAHSPLLAAARDLISSGALGRVVSIMGSALFYKPAEYFAAGPWRTRKGGGPILINLIHEIGNYRSMCGEIVGVHAMTSSAARQYEVEDTAAVCFSFASGAIGTFLLSDTAASNRSWEHTSGENPVYPSYPNEECYLVSGTLGSLSVPSMRVTSYADGTPSWLKPMETRQLAVERQDPLACQLSNFVDVIRGTAAPLVTARDGLRNLQIVDAIQISASERRCVAV